MSGKLLPFPVPTLENLETLKDITSAAMREARKRIERAQIMGDFFAQMALECGSVASQNRAIRQAVAREYLLRRQLRHRTNGRADQ